MTDSGLPNFASPTAMLAPDYQQQYAHFQQQVCELQQHLALPDRDLGILKAAVQQLQQWFQSELWPLNLDHLPPAIAQSVQSYQVEIDKQLRLLNLDMTFLQAARQADTIAKRQQQMRDRLTLLSRYCEAMLAVGS